MTTQITANNITPGTITSTQLVSGSLPPRIYSVAITDSSYNALDDTAANTTGSYIQITGANFGANSQIVIGANGASSVTYVNNTTLRAQVGAAAAATYTVYVVDTDTGATAIKVNGLTTSSFPAWGTAATLSNQASNTSFSVSLSANSDSSITYANTTALPAGTSLLANGYFYGTVSIGSQTTYNFTVNATDAEYQNASRTFSLTVTVIPQTRLWLWGVNSYGQLGTNDIANKSSPTQIGSGTTWNTISFANHYNTDHHALATKTDGTLWGWGRNSYGQVGDSTVIHRSSPVQIGSGTSWSKASCGALHSFGIKTDGTLWAWGVTNDGRLGDNITSGSYKSSPAQIGSATTWRTVVACEKTSIGVRTDGTLWSWGSNGSGLLGTNIGTGSTQATPAQVGGGTTWSDIAVGATHAIAIKTDGTLWLWGGNSYGQLGSNDTIFRSSPVQVGTGTNWSKVTTGKNFCLAIKTDGTLWSWGQNSFGALGRDDGLHRSSPTQVGLLSNWSEIGAGNVHGLAIKTDGTLWAWGADNNGQLGRNGAGWVSSPIQIGAGTNWSKVGAGFNGSAAITAN